MQRSSLRSLALGLGAFALVAAGAASARGGHAEYDWARVVEVRPIVQTVHHPISRDECWSQPVTYREPARYHGGSRDRAPAVLGGIVGGVVGNQFGSGRGRDAATAAGAALGYAMVRDSQRHSGGHYSPGREYTRYEQRCRVVTEHRREEQVMGYDVAYRYQGRTHWTRTDHHPGDRIRVRVDVRPVH